VALRLIHVGLGGWGGDWARNVVPRVPTVDRVAIVDADESNLATARKKLQLGTDRCFTDLRSAFDHVEADAVLITASVAAHFPLAVQALRAGKHVLVEKPFAPTVAEARQVVDVADEAGRTVMVSQNYRFFPAARAAADLVAQEYVGPLGLVRVDFRKWANSAPVGAHRHYQLVHPLLYDMSIHHFDLMRLVTGQEPVKVFAQVSDPPWSNFNDPAAATLTITFDGGTVVSYRGSWVSSGEPTTWSGDWHLECEKGEIYWTGRNGPAGSTDADVLTVRHLPGATPAAGAVGGDQVEVLDPVALAGVEYAGRAGALAEFARAIAAGEEPESSGRRNLGSLAISEAAARSVVSRQVELVTLT
jgi:predicted dehydrogenase